MMPMRPTLPFKNLNKNTSLMCDADCLAQRVYNVAKL